MENKELDQFLSKAMKSAERTESDFSFTKKVMEEIQSKPAVVKVDGPFLSVNFKIGLLGFVCLIVWATLATTGSNDLSWLDSVSLPAMNYSLPTIDLSGTWLYGAAAFSLCFLALIFKVKKHAAIN